MSKKAAMELFRSCCSETLGDLDEAAAKAAYYLFQELVQQLGKNHPRHRELTERIAANPNGPETVALESELVSLGMSRARRIFAKWATDPSDSRLNEIERMGLIDRLDIEFGGNISALARQIAAEEYGNYTPQQLDTVERRIFRLNAKRKKNPYWPQQEG
jgi:hypothetical protein